MWGSEPSLQSQVGEGSPRVPASKCSNPQVVEANPESGDNDIPQHIFSVSWFRLHLEGRHGVNEPPGRPTLIIGLTAVISFAPEREPLSLSAPAFLDT